MTQAPTPGPLSVGQEETIAFNLCAVHGFDPDFVKTQRDFALAVIREYEVVCRPRLAPTAPVEASGSERDAWRAKAAVLRSRGTDNTLHDINQAADYLDAAALRPQPSGETREPGPGGWLINSADGVWEWTGVRMSGVAAMTEGLPVWSVSSGEYEPLSARPPALGGQQGDGEGFYRNLLSHEDNEAWAALSTTPARAKAQDEGAAGVIDALIDGEWTAMMGNSPDAYANPASINYDEFVQAIKGVVSAIRAHPSPTPASPLPGGGWQDISTAPKDGTPFVGLKGRLAFRTTWREYYVKWPHEEGGPTFRGQWTYEDSSAHCPWNPTHWMPLPAAPTGYARNGKGEG